MEKFDVKLLSKAVNDLDNICEYYANKNYDFAIIQNILNLIENEILSLSFLPYRGALRKTGKFKNMGYRQLFVKSYVIVYRIDQLANTVYVVTIQHSFKSF